MNIALFDEIRIYYGSDRLLTIFQDLAGNNENEALKSVNQKNLQFPSLFILCPEIKRLRLSDGLNVRNTYAYNFISRILEGEELDSQVLLQEYEGENPENPEILRWMLESGYAEDGLSEEYDQVLDTAAICLLKVYGNNRSLKIIEDMIFSRYRKGSFIYDLTWAYFETINPQNLNGLAARLRSSEPKDVELARKLLNFIPTVSEREDNTRKQYQNTLKWISQNQNFLYYTGVTNNQTFEPARFAVSLEAKYLQKPAESFLQRQSRPAGAVGSENLERFNELEDDYKLLLSNYSNALYRYNRYKWNKWIQSPVERQIEIAERVMGDVQ
ncbi:hypothetical protein CLHUN_28710 [Ruminiclostridium hungatei]|uniref:Uncharacterized protein n=1 Tax=Ruminiclostridium hungatei TaxID=48256 RepID=A0A1V4SHT7_RUMHU|nr:hypothetical protein [Ruminiclostridium hungatei]OPX43323.1 hypothetical protein CLHUN_28710 [Ruminiclostridium hungatei]